MPDGQARMIPWQDRPGGGMLDGDGDEEDNGEAGEMADEEY